MVIILIILVVLFLGVITAIRISAFTKLKKQNQLIVVQSQEIQKQMVELERKNKMLNELNREKQQIIGVVSHDLKGPFNRIFAIIQLMSLSAENLTGEQKDYLGRIHPIVADGLSMVRNLTDNHRFEDKGIGLVLEPVNLAHLISPLIHDYRSLAEKKNIDISFDAPTDLQVITDKLFLSRVIDNLLSNALKFSFPESTIFVTLREVENFAEIIIQDGGPGFSADDRKKLFQKYQRLSAKPTAGESSTGLGLYIVKTIIDKMEGELEFKSEEGKGTRFTVRLKKSIEKIS